MVAPPGPRLPSKPLTAHAFGMTKLLIRIDLLSELAIARVVNSRTPNLVSVTFTSGRGLMAKTPQRAFIASSVHSTWWRYEVCTGSMLPSLAWSQLQSPNHLHV